MVFTQPLLLDDDDRIRLPLTMDDVDDGNDSDQVAFDDLLTMDTSIKRMTFMTIMTMTRMTLTMTIMTLTMTITTIPLRLPLTT